MQLLEDYSEPQPSMFYQTPQNEHIYQQKNKMLMEVYGFNDSFSTEASQELAPPPALPPKQRQLVSRPPPRRRDPLLPGPRGFPHGCSHFLPTGSPVSPPWGWQRPSLPEQPHAAGPGLCSECLLSLLTVSCIFPLFLGSNIDLPERRDSIKAQGLVCVRPSVDLIYIMAQLHRVTDTPPWPAMAPCKQALLKHDGLTQSRLCSWHGTPSPLKSLPCEESL